VEIAIGMEAMVTQNIATDASLANGSRGIILDIVLDPREEWQVPDVDEEGVVKLTYPPAMVLFEPFRKPVTDPLPGLSPLQIPIFPSEHSFYIGGKKGVKVTRRQLPLTPGYAFTDHKSQGQTLENVLVDIRRLSHFPVNAFATYVALSRSRGRHKIRLLRDFDDKLFNTHPSADLREEDRRLSLAAEETKQKWLAGFYKYDY
jgi:ATP-dependent exoDNAse (exonuclease V) alpha subunit